jgi:hypothetical protein
MTVPVWARQHELKRAAIKAYRALNGITGLLCTVASVERLAEHRFDDGLTTDVQSVCLWAA